MTHERAKGDQQGKVRKWRREIASKLGYHPTPSSLTGCTIPVGIASYGL
jgi:hypothetical protein